MSLPDLPAADRVCDVCDHVYHCGGGHCSDRAFVEADWHRLERAEKRIAELEALFGMSDPWPMADMLVTLAQAAEHLLNHHDCDCHGWENHHAAAEWARKYAEKVRTALRHADTPSAGSEDGGT